MYVPSQDELTSILKKIEEHVGPSKFRVWFKNATRLTIAQGHLKVSTPNAFLCGWIERHFAETIAEAANEVTGRAHRVSFVVDSGLLAGLKKRQLNSQADDVARHPERMARRHRQAAEPVPRKLRGRFEDLVEGPSNALAVSAVRRVAGGERVEYSPIFVHGGSGLGKTHLLQALANELADKNPHRRCKYVTGDEFTNEFVLGIRSNKTDVFRKRYRHLDVLIIDDVHFLANKRATQEEFLHTFNAIDGQRRTIVCASDTHPKLIGQFSEQLTNRFMAGMVVRLEVPDYAMRCEILRARIAQLTNQSVPDDVIAYIAAHVTSNIRELEGALLKLVMFSTVARQPITLVLARRALSEHIHRARRALGLDEIDQTVATYFGLTPADLHTSRKTRTIALARGVAMYLARKHTDLSFPEIGRAMGDKNHSTVILANRRIAGMLAEDRTVHRQTAAGRSEERLREIIARIEQQLGLATPRADQNNGPVQSRTIEHEVAHSADNLSGGLPVTHLPAPPSAPARQVAAG